MYIELALLDKTTTEEEAREATFAASELHLNGVCVLPNYVPATQEYKEDLVIACPIDYPAGTSTTATRNHAVLTAIKAGANTIDLVINHSFVVNKNFEKLLADLESNLAICTDKKVTMRAVMEYRVYMDARLFFEVIDLIKQIGIEYVLPSTGYRLDNYTDNLIAAKTIMDKSGLKVICNGTVHSKEEYEKIKKLDVYGVRFNSVRVARDIFGV